jgi:hypothetical protein
VVVAAAVVVAGIVETAAAAGNWLTPTAHLYSTWSVTPALVCLYVF